ncbi:MAG TPA: transketolase, partial [Chitinophagaceae bacterium]|nr:transketolase [Chitinophagaceae bacterium]
GSHERYKSAERLQWERDWDGIKKMKEWIIANALATEEELNSVAEEAKHHVRECKAAAWEKYITPVKNQVSRAADLINNMAAAIPEQKEVLHKMVVALTAIREPLRRDVMRTLHAAITLAGNKDAAYWT